MELSPSICLSFSNPSRLSPYPPSLPLHPASYLGPRSWFIPNLCSRRRDHRNRLLPNLASSYRWDDDGDDGDDDDDGYGDGDTGDDGESRSNRERGGFDHGVWLFNGGQYYKCHDVLESMWHTSPEPQRTVLHAILQCSVGLYHLLNQNHRGAMTELGEGLAKLRKQRFRMGPFQRFEQEMSEVLEYIYNTQLEHAACSEDLCIAMDGSQRSYQLLGNFASGKHLYELHRTDDELFIVFIASEMADPLKVKVPSLTMTGDDLFKL